MSLGAATAQIIFDMCRDHRKALAEEAWDAIGPINTGYLEMMEPPASFEPILIKPHPIAQVSFSEMDDEQRQLAEMAEDAQFMDDLTEKLEKLEDDGGWAKAGTGRQRHVRPAPGLSEVESKEDKPNEMSPLCPPSKMGKPAAGEPCGVHRTFLNADGSKRERKMLGRQGVLRVSPDEEVTHGLGIAEGVEDALAILASGWAPVWAATSAGMIERFPVLHGIECLTIFADNDAAGMAAAQACAERWADREVYIVGSYHEGLERCA